MTTRASRLSALAAPRVLAWLPGLAVAAGAAGRLAALGRKSLWLDEFSTLRLASAPLADLVGRVQDPHPPLYYLLMHYWARLGQDEAMLRLPSVIAGVAAIALLYWLVKERYGPWAGVAAAWLLALAPLHIWYSQEARMFALVCALGLLSALCYLRAIQRHSWLYWLAWVLVTAAGLYTDYSMLLLVLCQAGLYAYLWKRAGANRAMIWAGPLAGVTVALLYEPQARLLLAVLQQPWGITGSFFGLAGALATRLGLALPAEQMRPALVAGAALAAIITVALGNWLLPHRRQRLSAAPLLFWAAILTYALLLAASPITRALSLKRELLVLLPYVLAALALAVARQPDRSRLLLACLVLTLPAAGYAVLGQGQEDWRGAANFVEQRASDGDVVLLHAAYNQGLFDYYYDGSEALEGVTPAALPTLAATLKRYNQAWLVLNNDRVDDPTGSVQKWLDSKYRAVGERDFARVRVRLYNLR